MNLGSVFQLWGSVLLERPSQDSLKELILNLTYVLDRILSFYVFQGDWTCVSSLGSHLINESPFYSNW